MIHDLTLDVFWWSVNIYWSQDDFIKYNLEYIVWMITKNLQKNVREEIDDVKTLNMNS